MQRAILWMLYLALEPYGRRFWPDGLLGWTRLLSGHVRDPRIGREILIGCVFGGALMLARSASGRCRRCSSADRRAIPTLAASVEALDGFGRLFGTWADQVIRQRPDGAVHRVLLFVALRLIGAAHVAGGDRLAASF